MSWFTRKVTNPKIWLKVKQNQTRIILGLTVSLLVASSFLAATFLAATGASIGTDKPKYSLGEAMTISGTGFTANALVNISVLRPDKLTDHVDRVYADPSGAFTASYTPSDPVVPGRYKITADDSINTATTAGTEADALGFDLKQCAQDDSAMGQPLGLGFCNWIGSDLNVNNSHLFEGIATEQQLIITGISGTAHTLIVGIQATKGGKHAYDFLVSDAQVTPGGDRTIDSTLNSEQASLQTGITLLLNRCGDSLGNGAKADCSALVSGAVMSGGGTNTVDISVPDDPFISADGSTQTRINGYESLFTNRTVRLYTSAPISNVNMTLLHSSTKTSGPTLVPTGGDTGDTYIWYTITWTGSPTSAMLVGAADIALGGSDVIPTGREWGVGKGATGISGDPYHFFLISMDGTGGSLDNQMSAGAIFLQPATTLTLKSQTPAGANVAVGTVVTIVVTESNTGDAALTTVSVSGGGKCASFTGGATTLAVGASTDFTCTFTATAGTNSWFGDGHGLDPNGVAAPSTNEHVAGIVTGLTASTSLTLKSSTPADGSNVAIGTVVTIVVTETNTGTSSLSSVNVTGGGKCASFTGGATTLAAGAAADFTCTFTSVAGANAWSGDGHGTDQFGNTAPSTGEHVAGSVTGLSTSTSLTLKSSTPADGSNVAIGTVVTIVVTETNTGTSSLSSVNVTGGGKCASFTGGATTLAAGAATDFTCTFTSVAGANAWSGDGHGTDQFGNTAPSTGEHVAGSVTGLSTSTSLTLKSSTPADGSNVAIGTVVTIVVTETNTGTSSLSSVNVTGGGKCASFTGGATTLAAGAATDFTCTFTSVAGANAWSGDGHGTDQFGNTAPSAGEHVAGSVTGLTTSTTLTLVSQLPSPVAVGGTVTVIVRETNTGTTSLTGVNVTGGGKCATFGGGATTLAAGASTDFTCTFTAVAGANAWSADGHGTDQFGNPAPSAGEHAEGSVPGLSTSTTLTLVSQLPSPVAVGGTVTVIVRETNTGTTSLTGVNVTGGGKCATFGGGATTLAAGASTDFTCTFTAVAGANAWSADGHGTDQFGNPAPAAGEHAEGSVPGLTTSTTLTLVSQLPSPVAVGGTVTVIVRETNTGTTSLTGVNVTGGGKCATFGGGATTLAAGASTDFTCTFTAVAGANAWSADGHGTDQFGNPAPSAGEHAEGSVPGLSTSTTLTLVSQLPSPVAVGGTVTVIVRETNTGTTSLTGVNVTGGGKCATFGGGATTLAAGASTDFTCTFTAVAGANAWSADGHGTDQFGNPAPSAGEHAEGSVPGLSTSTTLTLKSSTPANGSTIEVGTTVTIVVTEANTGTTSLTGVNVTGGGKCATFGGGATTLAAGASTDFTCTFTAVAGANAWSADGHGTDQFGNPAPAAGEHANGSLTGVLSNLILVKNTVGGNGTFNFAGTGTGVTASFTVTTVGGTQTVTFANIPSGAKSLTETVPAGWLGNTTNVSCTETVAGITPSVIGTLTTGVVLSPNTVAANITNLGIGATVRCVFTNGKLPTLQINKTVQGTGTTTFTFPVTGANSLNPTITPNAAPASASYGPVPILPGNDTIVEQGPPAGWTLTDASCTGYTGGGTGAGPLDPSTGAPTSWNFTASFGDAVVCSYINNNAQATRTQGFWSTHTTLANNIWNGTNLPSGATGVIGSGDEVFGPGAGCPTQFTITALPVSGENILMGGFWASISQLSSKGGKRLSIDQARMQMIQQYEAAVLNYHLFGSIGETVLANARAAYCGTNESLIQQQIGILGGLNESGDSLGTTPGGSATTKISKDQADIDAWDTPAHPVD